MAIKVPFMASHLNNSFYTFVAIIKRMIDRKGCVSRLPTVKIARNVDGHEEFARSFKRSQQPFPVHGRTTNIAGTMILETCSLLKNRVDSFLSCLYERVEMLIHVN